MTSKVSKFQSRAYNPNAKTGKVFGISEAGRPLQGGHTGQFDKQFARIKQETKGDK